MPAAPLFSILQVGIVSIPRAQLDRHDRALSVVAELIRTGAAKQAIQSGKWDSVGAHIKTRCGIPVHIHGNAVIVDTDGNAMEHSATPSGMIDEVFAELKVLRQQLSSVAQTRETQQLLRELVDLRKGLAEARDKGSASIQVTTGFEVLGNGIKLVLDSHAMPSRTLERVQTLIRRLRLDSEKDNA